MRITKKLKREILKRILEDWHTLPLDQQEYYVNQKFNAINELLNNMKDISNNEKTSEALSEIVLRLAYLYHMNEAYNGNRIEQSKWVIKK